MCHVCARPGSASSTAVGSSGWLLAEGSEVVMSGQQEEMRPGFSLIIEKGGIWLTM